MTSTFMEFNVTVVPYPEPDRRSKVSLGFRNAITESKKEASSYLRRIKLKKLIVGIVGNKDQLIYYQDNMGLYGFCVPSVSKTFNRI